MASCARPFLLPRALLASSRYIVECFTLILFCFNQFILHSASPTAKYPRHFRQLVTFLFNFLWSVFYDSLYFSTYYLDSVNLPLLGRTSVFSVKVKTLQQVDAPQLDASDPFPFLFDGENMDGRPETKLAAFPASQLVDGTRSTVSSNLNGCLECSPLIRVPAYIEFCPPNNYSAF